MYLQEGEEGSYCIAGLEKSETQEREEKGKILNHLDCQQVMGVQLAWWGCVWLEADLLTLQMNCSGIFLFVVFLKPSRFICQIQGTFFTIRHRKPNPSVCRGDLPLLALASMAKTCCCKPSVAGDTNPSLPRPVILLQQPQGRCQTAQSSSGPCSEGLRLLPFIGNFIIAARCFGHWMQHFDASTSSKFQNLVSRNPSHPLLSAAK